MKREQPIVPMRTGFTRLGCRRLNHRCSRGIHIALSLDQDRIRSIKLSLQTRDLELQARLTDHPLTGGNELGLCSITGSLCLSQGLNPGCHIALTDCILNESTRFGTGHLIVDIVLAEAVAVFVDPDRIAFEEISDPPRVIVHSESILKDDACLARGDGCLPIHLR